MTETHDWELWKGSWIEASLEPRRMNELIARTRRARRAIALTRVLSAAIAVFALLVVAATLRHAGNLFERSLGFAVATGIALAWLVERSDRKHSLDRVESAPEEYAAVRRALCARRIRFAWFAWTVSALDLIFLVPWWIGGFAVHGAGFQWMQILTIWLPLLAIAGVAWWAARLRSAALAERNASQRS